MRRHAALLLVLMGPGGTSASDSELIRLELPEATEAPRPRPEAARSSMLGVAGSTIWIDELQVTSSGAGDRPTKLGRQAGSTS